MAFGFRTGSVSNCETSPQSASDYLPGPRPIPAVKARRAVQKIIQIHLLYERIATVVLHDSQ